MIVWNSSKAFKHQRVREHPRGLLEVAQRGFGKLSVASQVLIWHASAGFGW
jgi:hypothetical protein